MGSKTVQIKATYGTWKVTIKSALKAGTKVSAKVKVGLLTSASKIIYVIPATPVVSKPKVGATVIKGTATKGGVVYVTIKTKTYSAKVTSKGTFSIKVSTLKKGTTLTIKCKAGGKYSAKKVIKI